MEAQKRAKDTDDVLFNVRNNKAEKNHTDNPPEEAPSRGRGF